MSIKKITYTSVCLLSALAITACEPAVVNQEMEYTKASFTGFSQTTNERLNSAAKQAVRDGNVTQALHHYEKLYQNDSRNPDTALSFAQVLRETNRPERAIMVLSPFVDISEKDGETLIVAQSPDILLEYAAATLAVGRYDRAEMLLQELLRTPEGLELAPQAHNLIGVSLDSRGMHKQAEPYYRTALEIWSGDAVNVMNNLGLNLAHQGYFDEALTMLRQALVLAPQNDKVAANIDLVTSLNTSVSTATPIGLN